MAKLKIVEIAVASKRRVARVLGKVLGKLDVLGIMVPVVVTTPAEVKDDSLLSDGDHASFDPTANVIRVAKESSTDQASRNHHIAHEAAHALLGISGTSYYLRTTLKMTAAEYENVEEHLVRYMAPGLVSMAPGLAELMKKPVE